MTISQAIDVELIVAIRDFCKVSNEKAAELLKDAKSTSKMLGLPLAETLIYLGFVSG